jgi:hypothetical protein
MPAKGAVEGGIKEDDLQNRLAPEGRKEAVVKQAVPAPHGGSADVELGKDYQLQRALELMRSLSLVKEQGFTKP